MYIYNKVLFSLAAMLTLALGTKAQDKIVFPDISYAGTPRTCVIAGLNVDGIEGYEDRKSTRLNSSHANISYAVFCLKKNILILFPIRSFIFYNYIINSSPT